MENDLISKSRVLEILGHAQIGAHDVDGFFQWASDIVEEEPTISSESLQKRGEWVGEGDGYADGEIVLDVWYCSECRHCIDDGTDDPECLPNYCPSCGARMDLEKRNADTTNQKEMV